MATSLAYTRYMEFIETQVFSRRIDVLLDEEEKRELLNILLIAPGKGAVIVGSGGLRKLRFASRSSGRGKRGGIRLIYHWNGKQTIALLLAYSKQEAGNLSQEQLKILRNLVREQFK